MLDPPYEINRFYAAVILLLLLGQCTAFISCILFPCLGGLHTAESLLWDRTSGTLEANIKTPAAVKRELWRNIRDSVSGCGVQVRSHDNCRKRFDDIKRKLKVKLQSINKHAAGTGGGPPAVHLKLTPLEEQLSSKLPVIQVEGLEGDFDIGVFDEDFNQEVGVSPSAVSENLEHGTAPHSMQSQVASPDNSVAAFEDRHSEGTRSFRHVSQDPCSPLIDVASHPTDNMTDYHTANHEELVAIQEVEQRLLQSNAAKHSELMSVHQLMVTEIREVKDILRSTVTELRTHNSYMEAIVTCFMKQNDLQRSTVVASFLPSTFVATLEGADGLEVSCPTNSEAQGAIAAHHIDTCRNDQNIANEQHSENVYVSDNSGVPLVQLFATETAHTPAMTPTGTSSCVLSSQYDVQQTSSLVSSHTECENTNTNECLPRVAAEPGTKRRQKVKNVRSTLGARVMRSQNKK
ncbi:uncharacterized protein LOC142492010 [Ascaphus truei]|uniref:uncharacterized protein LOC142492010 n=1 Tax=Ascaphus truei TaxID=8439 RepID=UPI003F597F94